MMTRTLLLAALALATLPALAVPATKGKDKKKEPEPKKEAGLKSIKEVTKKCHRHEGLFTLYQDTASGALYLEVTQGQTGRDYLYFSQVADGVVDAGYFRGSYLGSRIFRIERHFDRVELRLRNPHFHFDPSSPLSRASRANINEPVLVSEKIEAANKRQDTVLIKADAIFAAEGLRQLKFPAPPGAPPGSRFDLGNLDKDRSKVVAVRNYPKNSDVTSEVVFANPYPHNGGSEAVSDARSVSVRLHHSLIELPGNDFRPRYDDPRVGYFNTRVTDMTSAEAIPWRDPIHRWHLKKKDPAAAISEPVEPIVWWIENTTPHELRPAIREGALAWNEAFEQAGFRDAIVVKEQPDTATWDAGDIRYNVLRWTSSPEPPFGGYGPSFTDPRTGQILGADVMLEWVFVTNRLREMDLFQTAGMGLMAMDEEAHAMHNDRCMAAHETHLNVLYGLEVLETLDLGEAQRKRFMHEVVKWLVLHEIGHTLGLNHNMKSSVIRTPDELRDLALTRRGGIIGSVMDYPATNLPWLPGDEVRYFQDTPGPYDVWAIRFGYTEVAGGEAVEELRIKAILAESTDPLHTFGNDADDMRSPGNGIDPRVMIGDLSSDPVEHGLRTIATAERTLKGAMDRYGKGDRSHQELMQAYMVLTGRMMNACNTMTRQVGGIHVDRSFASQRGDNKPYVPVPRATQKRAMDILAKHAFAPDAFTAGGELLAYLQPQRRGFQHYGSNEDPKLHDRVVFAQRAMLSHLLHANTLRRLVDSELYGNTYKLADMMTDLTNACFEADRAGSVNTFRQNLQHAYVDKLTEVKNGGSYREHARSMALYELDRVRKGLSATAGDKATQAHRAALRHKIDKALSANR